jgi:hypothetical protein
MKLKKKRCRLSVFVRPTQILFSSPRLTSSRRLPFTSSPLSFTSLSLHTRAPILTLGVRDKLLKGLFFFIFSSPLLDSRYYWDSVLSDFQATKTQANQAKLRKRHCLIYQPTDYGQDNGQQTKQEITFTSLSLF